nr:MAG TPA: hypothetical protein [Caudoviricetes sp.]
MSITSCSNPSPFKKSVFMFHSPFVLGYFRRVTIRHELTILGLIS